MGKYKKYRKEARRYAQEVGDDLQDNEDKSDRYRDNDNDEDDQSQENSKAYYHKTRASSSKRQENEHKVPCSWDKYKNSLVKMFFSENDIVSG